MQTTHQIIEDDSFECVNTDECETYSDEDYRTGEGRHLEPCEW